MIHIGDSVPQVELRTDEGTPITLGDFKGRALVLFLLGKGFSPTAERTLTVLTENVGRFLASATSPLAVLGENVAELAAYRRRNDVPFVLVSDPDLALHRILRGEDGSGVFVWLINRESQVIETIPELPPSELVRVAAERAHRSYEASGHHEDDADDVDETEAS